ncbi:VOC family protein [Caballeronia ptereochthonis]|uniref:3-demethylubiquinone-9 3-methyltransferase n=1 Tax=Caballeronia ptereochthonis TaxID=1777144 RepID=A0A158E0L6_9BURK|nr:VOC family protein [Caballeronia ptereochthonis]SAL00354.1 3-demethylubiquinone-9 3-methyltransferase [Caballeronia ptereochthonis]
MQKISPCLWFDGNAEEATNFYVDTFRNARIREIMRHTDASPGPAGSVLALLFELEGEEFMALNGGSEFKFTPAISMFVKCDTQDEIDHYWDKLMDGGQSMACGWLTDRFGVTWQIAPRRLPTMLQDPDPVKANRTMKAMMGMIKLDIAELDRAYNGA